MKLLISLLVGLCIGFFAGQLFESNRMLNAVEAANNNIISSTGSPSITETSSSVTKQELDALMELERELNIYRWHTVKYSNVEYRSYVKNHTKSELKSDSPKLKITCYPTDLGIEFNNTWHTGQNKEIIFYDNNDKPTEELFDISFSGDIEKEGRPRFLDLIKEHKSLEINGFVFELNSLETVPCLKSLVSSTN